MEAEDRNKRETLARHSNFDKKEMLARANKYRSKHGAPPLVLDRKVRQSSSVIGQDQQSQLSFFCILGANRLNSPLNHNSILADPPGPGIG